MLLCAPQALSRMESFEKKPEKPGQSCKGERADPHQHVGLLNVPPYAAHTVHVLLSRHRMDDTSGAKEQKRLEAGVGH